MRVIWLLGIGAFTLSALAFSACNRSDEEKEGAAPPRDPASTGAAAPNTAATAAGAIGGPAANTQGGGSNPAGVNPTPKPQNATDAGTPSDAGASKDGGDPPKSDAGTASSANSEKLKACAAKCQSVLQSCLTPQFSPDGGLPTIKDPAACQAAAETCRSSCTP